MGTQKSYSVQKQNLIDFEDMLYKAFQTTLSFGDYKMVMVDEVQDLTDLEWAVIKKLANNTEELHLVGDDDQAIYGWKGARSYHISKMAL